jgi:lipoprotein NlpD
MPRRRIAASSGACAPAPVRRWLRCVVLLALALLRLGCTSRPAPVSERGAGAGSRAAAAVPGQHRVREGDTLFSIAWRYGQDWRALAGRNGIAAPYTIYPGQLLVLQGAAAPATAARNAPAARTRPATVRAPSGPMPAWSWPVEGAVVRGFVERGAEVNKGIDIRGTAGADVRAAAAGEIVYAGSGLRGFSQLVIVKHDDTWLSAYAHNSRILVKEGDRLEKGGRVARLEAADGEAPLLHFEIRRDGKPVDPAALLPAR